MNHELESKLSQLEQERTEFKRREGALEQQAREAGEREKKWKGEVEERGREVATLQQQCADLGTTLQAREGELAQLTEKVSEVILVSWVYCVKTVDRRIPSWALFSAPCVPLYHTVSGWVPGSMAVHSLSTNSHILIHSWAFFVNTNHD